MIRTTGTYTPARAPRAFGVPSGEPAALRIGPNPGVSNYHAHGGSTAGHVGGVAPNQHTLGVRTDFSFTNQYHQGMLINGGLKTPPRF